MFGDYSDNESSWLDNLEQITASASTVARNIDATYTDIDRTFGGDAATSQPIQVNQYQQRVGQAAGTGTITAAQAYGGPITAEGIQHYLGTQQGKMILLVALVFAAALLMRHK